MQQYLPREKMYYVVRKSDYYNTGVNKANQSCVRPFFFSHF